MHADVTERHDDHPVGDVLRITLRVYDLDVPEAERDKATSAKDLVFDVGNETFGGRRMMG